MSPFLRNSAPTADDRSVITNEDIPVDITLSATDPENDPMAFEFANPSHGILYSNTATVSITVMPAKDVPVAEDDSATTEAGMSLIINLTENDTDLDGDSLQYCH